MRKPHRFKLLPHPEELSGAETLIMFKRSRIEAKADEIQERVDDLREAVRAIEQTLDEPLSLRELASINTDQCR